MPKVFKVIPSIFHSVSFDKKKKFSLIRRPGKTGGFADCASHVSWIAGYECDSVERRLLI
jgi:hypothetical protein